MTAVTRRGSSGEIKWAWVGGMQHLLCHPFVRLTQKIQAHIHFYKCVHILPVCCKMLRQSFAHQLAYQITQVILVEIYEQYSLVLMSFLAIVTVHTFTQVDLISFIPSYFHSLPNTHVWVLIRIVYLYIHAISLLENCFVDLIK